MSLLSVDRLAAWLVSGLLFAGGISAQIRSAAISGHISDPSGASVPNADVTVTNTGTNASFTTTSTDAGDFTVPYLANGTYTVEVKHAGFSPYRQIGVVVAVAQTVSLPVDLVVGGVAATVQVSGQAEQLQTESSQVSSAVSARVIDVIPNITQNPLYYSLLQNGVQPRNENFDSTGVSTYTNAFGIGVGGRQQFSAIGVNGGRAFTNDIQLDGLPIMGGGFNEAAIIPNTEGLQEVRVISNNFTADYGHGQSVLEMTTKSGTNQLHGEVNYLIRNDALNANSFANNALGLVRPPLKINQFGGAISGPIIKNRLFFSSSYHFLRYNQGVNNLVTVPTALERIGNFSQTLIQSSTGTPIPAQLYNPFSVTQVATNLYQRALFPNAIIPNANPIAEHILGYYPLPNHTPIDPYNTDNYASSTVNTVRRHTLNNRLDLKLGRHSIYASGGLDFGTILTPRAFGTKGFNDAPQTVSDRNPYGQIGDTVSLSPTLVFDVRYGVTRIVAVNVAGNRTGFTTADYNAFGIPASTQAIMAQPGVAPVVWPINCCTGDETGAGGGSNWTNLSDGQFVNKQEHQTSHVLTASISKVHGKWTHKAGVDLRIQLSNYQDFEDASAQIQDCCHSVGGNYSFEYVTAAGGFAPQNISGAQNGINGAALLLGESAWSVSPGNNVEPAFAQKYFAIYSQNDWHVTPRLTLNLGLRWDLQPGPTERYNQMSAYNFAQQNPFGTLGSFYFPGAGKNARNLWPTEYHDFGPRIGAAYRISNSLVIRGGFGITYLPSNTGFYSSPGVYGANSFAAGTLINPYGANPNGVPAFVFTDPSTIIDPTGSNLAAPQIYGQSNTTFNHRMMANGVAKQANFFIEKSFGSQGQWLLSAGYSGSFSDHLQNGFYPIENIQSIPASTRAAWLTQYIASNGATDPALVQVPNPWQPATGPLLPFSGALANATVPRLLTLFPHPFLSGAPSSNYVGGGAVDQSNGFGNYNSLQVRFKHAFSSGFDLEANYTWSKELDFTSTVIEDWQNVNSGGEASAFDLLNTRNNRIYGLSNQAHRFTGIAVYELPFGKSGRFALSNPIARSLLGGWTTSAVVTAQSGMPFDINGACTGAMVCRPDRVPGVSVTVPRNLQHWYNGTTSVTLPCGMVVTPPANSFLKYNACAFTGETLTTPDGSIVPNLYWAGNSAQTIGSMIGPSRVNVDISLRRTFSLNERFRLEIGADATNVFNHAEFNGNFSGGLGDTNLVNDKTAGLIAGRGNSNSFGTLGNATFDPRQYVMHARVTF